MPQSPRKQDRRDRLAGKPQMAVHNGAEVVNGEDDARDIANAQCGLKKFYVDVAETRRQADLGKKCDKTEVSYAPSHAIKDKHAERMPFHPTNNPQGRRPFNEVMAGLNLQAA